MSQNNGWDEYKLLVMDKLETLEAGLQRQDEDHAKVQSALADIRADLQGFKSSQRWELRILSAFWGLLVMAINAIIGRHG